MKTVTKKATPKSVTAAMARQIRNTDTGNWIYISPQRDKWSIRKDGTEKAIRLYSQRASAINAAKRILIPNRNSHIIIYNMAGEISKII